MIITVMINLPLPSKKGRSAGCQSQPRQETLEECAKYTGFILDKPANTSGSHCTTR